MPKCKLCGADMVLRTGPMTPEQEWCGVWYDHAPVAGSLIGHTTSVLYPSPELLAQEG